MLTTHRDFGAHGHLVSTSCLSIQRAIFVVIKSELPENRGPDLGDRDDAGEVGVGHKCVHEPCTCSGPPKSQD